MGFTGDFLSSAATLKPFGLPIAALGSGGMSMADAVVAPSAPPLIVRVDVEHRHKLTQHLQRLSEADRFLRFGFHATDERVQHYADGIDLDSDDVFAVLSADFQVVAAAHVAYSREPKIAVAEFGVSVDESARGQGLANALMQRAITHARSREVQRFFIYALAENRAMLQLARKVGMKLENDQGEVTGFMQLPPPNLESVLQDVMAVRQAEEELAHRKFVRLRDRWHPSYWLKWIARGRGGK